MAHHGRFLLRIEDIDDTRCRPQYETALFEDLAWLGLGWETPVLRQSLRLDAYRAALARLQAMGVVYRCFRTRAESLAGIAGAPHGPEPRDRSRHAPLPPDEEAESLAVGRPFAWRLAVAAALARLDSREIAFEETGEGPGGERGVVVADPAALDDIVVARKDVGVSYHLAVVVDDAHQGVTHVVRGQDIFEATPVQRLLQTLLGLPAPVYHHHRLILRPDGRRFAKRDAAETLRSLRERGVSAGDLRATLGV